VSTPSVQAAAAEVVAAVEVQLAQLAWVPASVL
jgi:hypothetical protein